MENVNKTWDTFLVLSYQSGDKKALGLLVKRWNKKLCAHAYRYTRDWESAKDITQDTWRIVITKIHLLRDANSFGSWVMTIVSRKALDFIKRKKKFVSKVNDHFFEDKLSNSEENNSQDEKILVLLNAIKSLPIEQQIVLKLFYLEAYSIKEISSITKVNENTVKTRLFRAREKMKLLITK